ncbi:hypothetical protein GJ700_14560 [Duganella sp. FT92W]|uniref:Uncharacterized protein n=1 Tax=Pseudoduganella rivuli TaxID=2666085 RepID=A0A7X2IND5_9BURK|nr:PhaM family polyhydroxyalkanoate granule multifunctional regulatory protein [Pseudoduganella rivuli]MRV72928.1 hypothetical protein [Pseudoduganella rivuli]
MALPQMPTIPGAAVMTDTLDFVKNLWGSMGVVPGIAAPTLSVDELDKKINDLKAVEAWLNLNSSMVRGSIQALEVQRNTIATLKSMGKSLATAVQQPGEKDTKSLFESIPYASAFFQHAAEALQPAAPGPAPKEAKPDNPFAARPEVKAAAPTEAPAATAAPEAAAAAAPTQAPAGANDAMAAAGLANPSVWWNLLQEQFKQAVTGAMSAEAVTGAAARATEAATKFAQAATQAATKPLSKAAAAATASTPLASAAKDEAAARKPARKPAAKKAAKTVAK